MSFPIHLELQDILPATQTRFIKEMESYLKREVPGTTTKIHSKPGNQDLGTILEIILAAPSVIIVAKGVADYLRRRNIGKVKIKIGKNSITATDLDSKSIVKIINELKEKLD